MEDSICWRIKQAKKLGVLSDTSMRRALSTINNLQVAPQRFGRRVMWNALSIVCNIDVIVEDDMIVRINANPLYIIQNVIFAAIDSHKSLRIDLLRILYRCLYGDNYSGLDAGLTEPATTQLLGSHGIYVTRNTVIMCTEDQYCAIVKYRENLPIQIQPEFVNECRQMINPAITPDELKNATMRLLEIVNNDQALFAILPRDALMSVFIGVESALADMFSTFV